MKKIPHRPPVRLVVTWSDSRQEYDIQPFHAYLEQSTLRHLGGSPNDWAVVAAAADEQEAANHRDRLKRIREKNAELNPTA